MRTEWLTRLAQVTVITLAMAAIFQELEKPKEERGAWAQGLGLKELSF